MTPITAESVRRNLEAVRNVLADAGGDPAAITVVAVTKGFGPEAPLAAVAAGLGDVGENYAQELRAKAGHVEAFGAVAPFERSPGDPQARLPRWHFIGQLQSNKIRSVAALVHLWQSIDRASLVDGLGRHAPGARVLIQVGATDEAGKGGCPPEEVEVLVDRARDRGLRVEGLMVVGAAGDPAATRAAFTTVAGLADRLGLAVRSMGMSDDLADAVAAGTTMVRVGTALFGPRVAAWRPPGTAGYVRD